MVIPACLEQIKGYVLKCKSKMSLSASPKVDSDGRNDLSISCGLSSNSTKSRSNESAINESAKSRSSSVIQDIAKSRSNSEIKNGSKSRSNSVIQDNEANIYEEIRNDRLLGSSRSRISSTVTLKSDCSPKSPERSALNRTGPFSGSRPIAHECAGSKVSLFCISFDCQLHL